MALDFLGTFIRGQIRRFGLQDEAPIELWTDSGHPDLKALSFVSEMTVTTKMGLNSEISILLSPPFDDGIKLLNSDLIKWGIGHLTVSFGYTTGSRDRSLAWSGLLMTPDVQISGTDISITLKATGVGYPMSVAGSVVTKDYTGKAYNEVAEDILRKYSKSKLFTLDEDKLYPDFTAQEMNPETGHPFFKIPKRVIRGVKAHSKPLSPFQQGTARFKITDATDDVPEKEEVTEDMPILKGPRNDWWFLTSILRYNGLSLIVSGEQVQIRQPDKVFQDRLKTKKIFGLRAKIDTDRGIYPILGFSSPTTAVFLSPGVGGYIASDVGTSKATVSVEANADTTDTGTGTDNPSPSDVTTNTAEGGLDAKENLPADPESIHADAIRGSFNDVKNRRGVEITVESLGLPDMLPEDICVITGFSLIEGQPGLYDGEYRILEVSHRIGTSGFTTTFKALGSDGSIGLFARLNEGADIDSKVVKAKTISSGPTASDPVIAGNRLITPFVDPGEG
jgi:hypothetical protein